MIGDIFRQEREKRQITLKDVENETNIRILYLEAIEKGDYKVIRGEVYLKGFIKTYAKFLDIDYNEILKKYYEENGIAAPEDDSYLRQHNPQTADESAASDQQHSSLTKVDKSESGFRQRVEERRKKRSSANIVFGLIIAIVVIGCAAYFVMPLLTSSGASVGPVVPAADTKAVQPAAEPVEKTPVPVEYDGVHMEAVFNNKCWVEVKVDGKTVLEKTVDQGSTFKWDGKQEIQVILGNAGAVKIMINGKDAGSLGADGAVVTKKFTKDKIEDVKK
ncbi:helix-turn-helix domain-containing protein [Pectinatus haikarae]|uniref:Cytoskeletal protein RodZ n=1 Tax=Pectinatus haikarae TaxID=349096 RepID=A0ABT9Y5N1_9FIRM|nr:helix-turn-helix domain-containing protein [Pectinatus haikarae]MDQ0203019.1 cytoskeletal protein RodZ [Pectinatus haikarae]